MLLHISRSRPRPFLFRTYCLAARLEVSAEELSAIRAHRLDRFEIFADPFRDHLLARADKARERQRAMPWIMDTPQQVGALWLEIGREMTLLVRARWSFRITIGDLIAGVSISNRSLNAIRETERVLVALRRRHRRHRCGRARLPAGRRARAHAGRGRPGTPPDEWGSTW